MTNKPEPQCSFCGTDSKHLDDSKGEKLFEGTASANKMSVYVCTTCISNIQELMSRDLVPNGVSSAIKTPKPSEIKSHLDQYIIGQEYAKTIISVAVADHYKRVKWNLENKEGIQIDKSNVLMLGPTGVGKTHIARAIAEYLEVPFAVGDATSITEAGYVGEDVESLLLRLIQAADGNIELAQRGILFIDEFDKLRRTTGNVSITRDVGGQGVQQALLKLIEGSICNVPKGGGRKHPNEQCHQFDTTNVLFVCSGAFVGLEETIQERLGLHNQKLGFETDVAHHLEDERNLLLDAEPVDIVKYGMIPEIVGRLPVMACLEPLTKDALGRIFREPKNSLLDQYRLQFKLDGIELELTTSAINEIVEEAFKLGTGARALRAIAEKMILPYKFNIEKYTKDKYCKIDGKIVVADFPSRKGKRVTKSS